MVLKYVKKQTIQSWYPTIDLEGHIFIYGKLGSGKSVAGRTVVEAFHDNRFYKAWDLFGGERHEGIYWVFPSQDKAYWNKMKSVGNFDEDAPKQYKVNLLYPCFMSMLPKKLPYKKGYVTSKVFTIPLKDVTIEDIKCVLGTTSDTSGYVWNEIINKITKKDTSAVLDDLVKKFGGANTLLNKNFIIPIAREKFLMNEYCSTNIDLKAEADDREAITVLCLEFVPQKFHLFVMDYIIRRLTLMAKDGKIKKKNLGFIREGATFFRADDDVVTDEKIRIFRSKLSSYMRYSRSGFNFVVDTQSPNETKGILSGADDMTILFKITSPADKEIATELYRKEKRMRPDQIADLSFLDKGEAYICATNMRSVQKVKFVLPRSCYWRKEYPNFYKYHWESMGGDWKGTEFIKEEIDTLFETNKNKYQAEANEKKDRKNKIREEGTAESSPFPFGENFEKIKGATGTAEVQPSVEIKVVEEPEIYSSKDFTGSYDEPPIPKKKQEEELYA